MLGCGFFLIGSVCMCLVWNWWIISIIILIVNQTRPIKDPNYSFNILNSTVKASEVSIISYMDQMIINASITLCYWCTEWLFLLFFYFEYIRNRFFNNVTEKSIKNPVTFSATSNSKVETQNRYPFRLSLSLLNVEGGKKAKEYNTSTFSRIKVKTLVVEWNRLRQWFICHENRYKHSVFIVHFR